ncbi:hypothetical protein CGGC5_v017206 [Colletotrichum fructicola Nara gc5]|uniref:Uncharacterized protein n=1 Tax=Colletotrichum fructicola (strain Nara gc5) TaxID=1213859 RepID=A0A7J6ID75_COLFN|nr:hypothetical protein CGGC5_v017206 [Colletotrichum fructicola Nara gc5]
MLSISIKHLVLLFVSLANFVAAERALIGYRKVNEAEAKIINRGKNIFRDAKFDEQANLRGLAQIGNGVYLSMALHGYRGDRNDWWCYVEADIRKLAATPKVWIPQSYWYQSETNLGNYVQAELGKTETAFSAIRMSHVQAGHENNIQALLPTRMVQHNVLDTFARCYKSLKELPYSEPVSFESWRISGQKVTSGPSKAGPSGGRRPGKTEMRKKTEKGKTTKGN